MGWFSPKPSRALQAELMKQANGALNILGIPLLHGVTNPAQGHEPLDLKQPETRTAIRDELVRIIQDFGLEGCKELEIGGARLIPLVMDESKSAITDAAVTSALAINSINIISRYYFEEYPEFEPLREMVNELSKTCCAGAAQTFGNDLPIEVIRTWPYFSRIFAQAKNSRLYSWPDV